MKSTAKTAVWAVILVFSLGVILSISDAVETTGETVQQWSPENQVQAQATATAIELVNEPTRTWIEDVVPTQQAVERGEIIETTRREYGNQREIDKALTQMKVFIIGFAKWSIGISIAIVGLSIVTVLICLSIRQVKLTSSYEPVQVLQEKPLYFPQQKMLADPRTGLTWEVEVYRPASIDHGTLLIESKTGGKPVRFTPRNGNRHPETVIDAKLLTGRDENVQR